MIPMGTPASLKPCDEILDPGGNKYAREVMRMVFSAVRSCWNRLVLWPATSQRMYFFRIWVKRRIAKGRGVCL